MVFSDNIDDKKAMPVTLPKNLPLTAARLQLAAEFLAKNNFAVSSLALQPIAKDAGERRYLRVIKDKASYVLMDCPPNYQSIKQFLDVGALLKSHGFNSPDILFQCQQNGFILMEDFGKQTVNDFINANPGINEGALYLKMIEMLVQIQQQIKLQDCANLPAFNQEAMLNGLQHFTEWYLPDLVSQDQLTACKDEFFRIWRHLLSLQAAMAETIVHRDFHVQNLMMIASDVTKAKTEAHHFGLLDFQDASVGSPVYDLVSILQDARRSVTFSVANEAIRHFAELKDLPIAEVLQNYHILGTVRNLRVIGVFTRLAKEKGERKYLNYLPNLFKYLSYSCSHDILKPLAEWLDRYKIIR